jgi:hypothetical protein
MSLCYEDTLHGHLAEYLIYLSTAQSFWFSLNSSYDHDFHLSQQFGMTAHSYECLLVAANQAVFLTYLRTISSFSILISSKTTGLPLPWHHLCAFRRRSVAVTPSIALALAPSIACRRRAVRCRRAATAATLPPHHRQAAAAVALTRCRHRRCHRLS